MLHPDRVFTLIRGEGQRFRGLSLVKPELDVHIGTLPDTAEACGEYIKTVRGVGYRMEEPHD